MQREGIENGKGGEEGHEQQSSASSIKNLEIGEGDGGAATRSSDAGGGKEGGKDSGEPVMGKGGSKRAADAADAAQKLAVADAVMEPRVFEDLKV